MKPLKKAEELISDLLQMQPILQMQPNGQDEFNIELAKQYEYAKLQAEYACHNAKFSHSETSKKFKFWSDVQAEIKNL